MLNNINLLLSKISAFFNPFCQRLKPLYKKIKPLQDKLSARFFETFCRPLTISPKEKQKIFSGNLVRMFRFYTVMAIILQIFASVLMLGTTRSVWNFLIIYLPLLYLALKGYRISYLLLILVNTVTAVLAFIKDPSSVLLGVFLWAVFSLIYAFAFKYENGRIIMEKSRELKHSAPDVQKDVVAAVLIMFLALLIAGLVSVVRTPNMFHKNQVLKSNYQLNRAAGTLSRHLYGYSEFCREQGYELKIYPASFARYFAPEIARVQEQLQKQNSSLPEYYNNAKRIYGQRLIESIAQEMDGIRRQAIVEMVALDKNIRPSEVKWDEKMDGLISMQEACVLFDEISDSAIAAAGRELAQSNPRP